MFFDPDMFTSHFWDWFITIITILSIAACFALIIWMSRDRPSSDEEVKTMGHVWDGDLEEYNNPLPMWWLNMFYITLFFGIVYLILYPGLGSYAGMLKEDQLAEYERQMKSAEARFSKIYDLYADIAIEKIITEKPEAVQIGQRLFSTYCTMCHGSDAGGIKGYPNLRDDDWLWGGEPQAIKTSIMQGRNGLMPSAEANNLKSEEDIKNVSHYVLKLSGQEEQDGYDAEKAEKGEKVFMGVCAACHTPAGTGMTALGAPNLTDDTWLYGGDLATIEETIRNGRQNRMPAHGDFLGEEKVHLLAAYVYSLSN